MKCVQEGRVEVGKDEGKEQVTITGERRKVTYTEKEEGKNIKVNAI